MYNSENASLNQIRWDLLMPASSTVDKSVSQKYIDEYILWAEHNHLYIILSFPTLSDAHMPN